MMLSRHAATRARENTAPRFGSATNSLWMRLSSNAGQNLRDHRRIQVHTHLCGQRRGPGRPGSPPGARPAPRSPRRWCRMPRTGAAAARWWTGSCGPCARRPLRRWAQHSCLARARMLTCEAAYSHLCPACGCRQPSGVFTIQPTYWQHQLWPAKRRTSCRSYQIRRTLIRLGSRHRVPESNEVYLRRQRSRCELELTP